MARSRTAQVRERITVSSRPAPQLVKYQYSGLYWYWEAPAKLAGGPCNVSLNATTTSGAGWNRPGCCSVI
jgi:hypothetical protein